MPSDNQRKLVVHIGGPKTGTSAIQQFCLQNRDALLARGVLYPKGGMLKSAHHLIGAAIHPARAKRLGKVPRDEVLATALAEIRAEVELHSPQTLVISTEYLWGTLSAGNVRRLLEPFSDWKIQVLAYLRRQDLFAQSLYVQAVKTGTSLPFADWVAEAMESDRGGFFYHQVLKSWHGCGLPVSVLVRIYERRQIGEDICADFLDAIGAGAPELLSGRNSIVNTGPDMATTELLRIVNGRLKDIDRDQAERIRRDIIRHSPPRALFAPLQYFVPNETATFVGGFEADNALVAREFMAREDGVLFRDPLPSATAVLSAVDSGQDPQTLLHKLIDLLPLLQPGAPKPADASADEDESERRRRKQERKRLAGTPSAG